MVVTAKLAGDLKTYLEGNLNGKVTEVGTAIGKTIKSFKHFQVGWISDPFTLPEYNDMFVVPDRLQVRSSEEDILFPFDLVAVVSAATEEDVTVSQLAALDALYELVEDDPELGGLCFEALVVEANFFAPVPGMGFVAITHIKLNLSVDTLLA